jgi:hypothetical protein
MTDSNETPFVRLPVREMRDEPAPQRAAQEGDLPPLPEPKAWMDDEGRVVSFNLVKRYPEHRIGYNTPLYTADQLRTAIAAAGGGVPQGDSYDAIWNALQRIDSVAVLLPTFEVRHEGGIEAFTQNIVDAIVLASSPQPEAASAVAQVPQGWKLVPLDALNRCVKALLEYTQAPENYHAAVLRMRDALRAMLAAAPEAPAQHCEHLRPMDKVCAPCRRYPNREAPAQAAPSAGEVGRSNAEYLCKQIDAIRKDVRSVLKQYNDPYAAIDLMAHRIKDAAIDAAISHKEQP